MKNRLSKGALCALPCLLLTGAATTSGPDDSEIPWDEEAVEHLLNRAGWGGSGELIAILARRSPEEVVDGLLEKRHEKPEWEPVLVELLTDELAGERQIPRDELEKIRAELRLTDNNQFRTYAGYWYQSMIDGKQPLVDRMTMFWHGFFPVSTKTVQRKYEVIKQHMFLEEHAIGNFETLMRGIAHDPAMLWFLDNDTNVKGHPNENLGRELMELFSLGEGNYTEVDVREAARCLTGVANSHETGQTEFHPDRHDAGEKVILGRKGKFGSNELCDILLEEDSCARWVCFKILSYFEGVEPDAERVESYAVTLREAEYELKPVLRRLFLDPDFYREEIRGARVQSPIDFMIGSMRRLELTPPIHFTFFAGKTLGQGLYDPPSVEGWHEGEEWITNESLMQRGNCIGILLGVFNEGFGEGAGGDEMMDLQRAAMTTAVVDMRHSLALGDGWKAPPLGITGRLKETGLTDDTLVVQWLANDLLAIQPPQDTYAVLAQYLASLRNELRLEGALIESTHLDTVVRRLAHMILSLPEAQLG